ncbi:MAG: hypothetical protein IKP62_02850 [Salinivirgaceae bacterium]|nr:hypothetical protein [Salinivirgaceae bacterium]
MVEYNLIFIIIAVTFGFIHNRKNNNRVELRFYFSEDKLKKYISTSVDVEPKYWNDAKECISEKCENHLLLQEYVFTR